MTSLWWTVSESTTVTRSSKTPGEKKKSQHFQIELEVLFNGVRFACYPFKVKCNYPSAGLLSLVTHFKNRMETGDHDELQFESSHYGIYFKCNAAGLTVEYKDSFDVLQKSTIDSSHVFNFLDNFI